MKSYLVILLLIVAHCCKAQTVTELWQRAREEKQPSSKQKKILEQILEIDRYNEQATQQLCTYYYKFRQEDAFFKQLIQYDTTNIKGYLLALKYDHKAWATKTDNDFTYLEKALTLDPNNYEVVSIAAQRYERRFKDRIDIDTLTAEGRKRYKVAIADKKRYAEKAKRNYLKAVQLFPKSMIVFRYSILTLSEFLEDTTGIGEALSYNYVMRVDADLMPVDSPKWYFPLVVGSKQFYPDASKYASTYVNARTLNWYSRVLYFFKEPVIYYEPADAEVYRFTWLRAFDAPVVVRVETKNEKRMLYWKTMARAADKKDKSAYVNKGERPISDAEWQTFQDKLDSTSFWQMAINDDARGADGAEWLLEGSKAGQYHVVDRWSPEGTAYNNACLFLYALAGFDTDKTRVY